MRHYYDAGPFGRSVVGNLLRKLLKGSCGKNHGGNASFLQFG